MCFQFGLCAEETVPKISCHSSEPVLITWLERKLQILRLRPSERTHKQEHLMLPQQPSKDPVSEQSSLCTLKHFVYSCDLVKMLLYISSSVLIEVVFFFFNFSGNSRAKGKKSCYWDMSGICILCITRHLRTRMKKELSWSTQLLSLILFIKIRTLFALGITFFF